MSKTKELLLGFAEENGNASIQKLVMRPCGSKIWKELHLLMSKEILVEVEHVKAHRAEKDKHDMMQFEKFVADGDGKGDELAKEGAMLDEGFMAKTRAKTVQQEREECTQLCSSKPAFTAWWRNGKIVQKSSRSQKKSGPLWTRKEWNQGIERNGVLLSASTDA